MLLDWDIEPESYRNPQASNWASKKSREFKAYVRGSEGEFGDVGFESQGKEKTEVQRLSLFSMEMYLCCILLLYISESSNLNIVDHSALSIS